MSIENKLTYLDGTKQALKESINNLGGDITNETTFREYATELDNIYDNLPKTTGEDTSLSLTTLKGKMNIIPKGDTYQYTTTGKNKIPYPYAYDTRTVNGITFTVNTDGTINVNGTATANATFVIQNQATASGLRELLLNNNCFLSGCPSGGSSSAYMQLYGYSSGGTGAKADTGNGVSVAGFVNENNNFNIAIVILSGTTVNNLLFAPQLEIGSSKTPWEPYTNGASPNPTYPQDIEVVTGTQEVKVENVNLLDISQENINIGGATSTIAYDNEGYMIITNNNSSASYINIPIASVEIGSSYTLKVEWGTSELTYIYLQNSNSDYSKYVYTTTTTTTTNTAISNFLKVLILVNANKTIKVRVQVQKGNTISGDYTPHQEQTYQLSLGEYEFAKIGNYVDTIEYDVENDKVYKNKAINKKIFDGSETGWERNTTTLGYRYRINQADIKPNADTSTIASIYCNYLRATSPDRLYNNDNYSISCFSGTSHTIIIACIDSNTDTLEKWKTWLSTHNLEVYYVLAEATKEEITGTLKDQIKEIYNLKSYNGTTNINSSGSLPMILNVSAIKGE